MNGAAESAPHPARIGRYRLVRRISGPGGGNEDCEVFLAIAEGPAGFERAVALKRQRSGWADDPAHADRVIREAMVYSRVSHPAIVQLFDLFEADGHVVMVREYVHGPVLSQLLAELHRRGARLPDPACFFLVARIFDALAAAHAARHPATGEFTPVIHRDVTPANVLVPWDGYAKLSDFGMAKLLGRSHDSAVGLIKGTFGYLAPEQVLGDPITVRTDLYGAAIVAREIFTGVRAFPRAGRPELEYLQWMAEPRLEPLHALRPDLPYAVLEALARAAHPDPDRRAVSAMSVVDVLRDACDLERGRRVLVDVLSSVREQWRRAHRDDDTTQRARIATAARPSIEHAALATNTTPAPTVASIDVAAPALARAETVRLPRKRARAGRRGWSVAVAAALAMLAGYLGSRRAHVQHVTMAGEAWKTTQPAPPASMSAPPRAPPKPTIAPDRGYLHTPIEARQHRIFVDGRFAGVGGATIAVLCGVREVKVGSAGRKQRVHVPCGGHAAVTTKW